MCVCVCVCVCFGVFFWGGGLGGGKGGTVSLWWAQRTSFNTLDNWGHKTPTQSKRKRTGKKRLKDHSPKYIQYTRLHIDRQIDR